MKKSLIAFYFITSIAYGWGLLEIYNHENLPFGILRATMFIIISLYPLLIVYPVVFTIQSIRGKIQMNKCLVWVLSPINYALILVFYFWIWKTFMRYAFSV